ncbi:hypothetical protein [Kitasatospora sp. NPDC089509]|uniref:hypothetical protein n=1 Tax=Kitasatospora sp. NPDC089509 TaxID=3364079 RepID=UPI003830AE8B
MSFEDRLGDLLKDDDDPGAAGPDPVVVLAGARRRRARRRVGAGAAALAVALVCGATAVTAGGAGRDGGGTVGAAASGAAPVAVPSSDPTAPPGPTGAPGASPTATPSPAPTGAPSSVATPLPLSPVRQVAPGEKITIADDTRIWVTATERCDETRQSDGSWRPSFGCRDATSDNLDHFKPQLYSQGLSGMYLGPMPARVVAFRNGRPTVATLVTTAGMKGWAAYYVELPPMDPAQVDSFVMAAYDAQGKLLAENPFPRRDGGHDHAPATL